MHLPVQWLLYTILNLYFYLLIGHVILSWLVAFNVINTRNQFVYMVGDFLHRITEPALRPIRRILPDINGIDLSPVILLIAISFLQILVINYVHF